MSIPWFEQDVGSGVTQRDTDPPDVDVPLSSLSGFFWVFLLAFPAWDFTQFGGGSCHAGGKSFPITPEPKETMRTHMMGSEEEEEELAPNAGLQSMGEAVTWREPAGTPLPAPWCGGWPHQARPL